MTRIRGLRLGGALLLAGVMVSAALTTSAETASPRRAAAERDLGSAPAARTAFSRQDQAAKLEAELRESLGEAFGGAHLDPGSGRLVVGVTEPGRLAAVRSSGANAKLVRYSQRSLDAVQAKLDRIPPAPGIAGWYVDVIHNDVVVEVDRARSDATTTAYLARARAISPVVRTVDVPQSPRALHSMRGGYTWDTLLARCSVGFTATGRGGSEHFVTAGHCTQGIGPAYGHNNEHMGWVGGSTFGLFGDYGKVNLRPEWRLYGKVSKPGPDVSIKGSRVAPIGAWVCRAGATTKWRCGRITGKNHTVVYLNGGIVGGLTGTTACAEPGDSGGSFVWRDQAQGMTSGGNGDCRSGGRTYFQPLREALSAYGLRLVTS